MKKDKKIDMKLTKKVADSLSVLKQGTKNSFVMSAVDSLGSSTVLSSKGSSAPLKKGLNFTSFKMFNNYGEKL